MNYQYDNLHICPLCEDRYTNGVVCGECARQCQADERTVQDAIVLKRLHQEAIREMFEGDDDVPAQA